MGKDHPSSFNFKNLGFKYSQKKILVGRHVSRHFHNIICTTACKYLYYILFVL